MSESSKEHVADAQKHISALENEFQEMLLKGCWASFDQ
jgi:hypothetical protein